MARRGRLDVPVIGVAKSGWTLGQLRERARDSVATHGGGVDAVAFAQLEKELRYIEAITRTPSPTSGSAGNSAARHALYTTSPSRQACS